MQNKCAWAKRLENVLNDYDALQAFQLWMGIDDDSSEHPLRLYFAIIAYCDCCKKRDLRANKLAHEIYNKFLRPKTGLCAFINLEAREEIKKNLLKLSPNLFLPDIFDPCISDLYKFLRRQHALFIDSQEFIDFYNYALKKEMLKLEINQKNLSTLEDPTNFQSNDTVELQSFITPTKLISSAQSSPFLNPAHAFATMSRSFKQKPVHQFTKLTPSSLLQSQHNRESTLGQSLVEKLYKPVFKYPYVGQPTTSKNDSSVSSSFSNDGNNSHHSVNLSRYQFQPTQNLLDQKLYLQSTSKTLKNEQKILNPILNDHFLRLDHQLFNLEKSSIQFNHLTEEGRNAFVNFLTKKLQKIIQMREMNKAVEKFSNEQFLKTNVKLKNDIVNTNSNNRNVNDANINETNVDDKEEEDEEDEATRLDAVDKDVDNYFSSRLVPNANDSSTLSSQQQTPPLLSANNNFASTSTNYYQQPLHSLQVISKKKDFNGNELQPCVPEQKLIIPESTKNNSLKKLNNYLQTSINSINHEQSLITQSYINSQLNQTYLPQNFSHLQQINLCPATKFQSQQETLNCSQHDNCGTHISEKYGTMQSCNICSENKLGLLHNIGLPKTQIQRLGFAPPPGKSASVSPYKDVYYDNDGDTSGIGTLTYISDASRNSDLARKQRAAMFKKARKLNEANTISSEPFLTENDIINVDETKKFVEKAKTKSDIKNNTNSFAQLSLDSKDQITLQKNLIELDCLTKNLNQLKNQQKITVVYRRYNGNNNGNIPSVPIVAHVTIDNNKGLTLKEFRRLFLISSKEKIQYFFRTVCDDGSAPYQLLLVNNDLTVLPIFEEKITAECRCLLDSD